MSLTRPLGELCTIVGGGTPSRKNSAFFGGDIPWVSIKDLVGDVVTDPEEFITQEAIASSATRIVPKGAILVATRVGLGKVAVAGRPVAINQDIKALTPTDELLPEYLFWHMRAHGPAIERMGVGATVKGITLDDLRRLPIRVLPLEEQRRIVHLLSRAAGIRRLAEAAQAKARDLIPALFVSMFGNEEHPRETVEQLLADVPQSMRTGPFGSQLKHSEFTEEGFPVLGIDNAVQNRFAWGKARFLPHERFDEFARYRVRAGDVIITIMGTTGRVAVVPDEIGKAITTKHLCALTLDRSKVIPWFFWGALLFDPAVRAQTAAAGNGAIMEGWNMGVVRRLSVPVPPLQKQEQFAARVAEVFSQQEMAKNATLAAEALSQSLMAQVFAA